LEGTVVRGRRITPDNTVFVILSFEGPDHYSGAGGLGVRIDNLSSTLVGKGFSTHLFFVGDPGLKGEEVHYDGQLILHRWCQWISQYYPCGVYEGENDKVNDFNDSVPWYLVDTIIRPAIARGKLVVILGEEWQTAEAMCRLSDTLHCEGLRDRVVMFWNANNTFSFDRVNWERLNLAVTITTVSRYMKHIMWGMRLNPLVIPNGIPKCLLEKIDDASCREVRNALNAELILCKVARWDRDKRWNEAVRATARLKDMGLKALLLARGGAEPYGAEVMSTARSLGLEVKAASAGPGSPRDYIGALQKATPADVVDVRSPLPLDFLRLLYCASDGVLANSGHEPFGLVGLETMAAGGVAFTGCTGEDYAIAFVNAFVLETADPGEIVDYAMYLRDYPEESARIRKAARRTAVSFTWDSAVQNLIRKLENQARVQKLLSGAPQASHPGFSSD
jgi:glycosyltransferase involved in cell wall biosynthesis